MQKKYFLKVIVLLMFEDVALGADDPLLDADDGGEELLLDAADGADEVVLLLAEGGEADGGLGEGRGLGDQRDHHHQESQASCERHCDQDMAIFFSVCVFCSALRSVRLSPC